MGYKDSDIKVYGRFWSETIDSKIVDASQIDGFNLENGQGSGSLQQVVFDDDSRNPIAIGTGSLASGGFRGDKPNDTPIDFVPENDKNTDGLNAIDDTTTYVGGIQAASFGAGNRVYGDWDFVAGKDNKTTGRGSFVFGGKNYVGRVVNGQATTDYLYSMAIGGDNIVRGDRELVTGVNNTTANMIKSGNNILGGYANFIAGSSNSCNENTIYTSILGSENTTSFTDTSIVGGDRNTSIHTNASAIFGVRNDLVGRESSLITGSFIAGGFNKMYGSRYSTCFGYNNTVNYDYQTVIGLYNDNKTNTLFEIGNGTSDSDRENAFEVLKDGRAKVYEIPTEDNDVLRWQEKEELESHITDIKSIMSETSLIPDGKNIIISNVKGTTSRVNLVLNTFNGSEPWTINIHGSSSVPMHIDYNSENDFTITINKDNDNYESSRNQDKR